MSTNFLNCGIDIAADTIEVCIEKSNEDFERLTLPNTLCGFKQLLSMCKTKYHFVMETTGVYHLSLCFFLYEKNQSFSVVNALVIKRYIQMKLERNKTDKIDAKHICLYGIERKPECYQMPDQEYFECKSLNNALESITQEVTSFTNKIHALKRLKIDNNIIIKAFQKIIATLKAEYKKIEQELTKKLASWQPELVPLVSSVVGIGKKATSILIISTQGFKTTESYQQLISYAGLSPKEFSSGSSIKGRKKICKQGGKQLRHTMYMCALNAKKNNPACAALFNRLVDKGKNKKLALIAVCNKLLKQVFAIVKSGVPYQKNYLQKIA